MILAMIRFKPTKKKSLKSKANDLITKVNNIPVKSLHDNYNKQINNIKTAVSGLRTFSSNKTKNDYISKLKTINSNIDNDVYLTKNEKTKLKNLYSNVSTKINSILVQLSPPPAPNITYDGDLKIVISWSDLVKAKVDEIIITAMVVSKKNITVNYLNYYYELINNDISDLNYSNNKYMGYEVGERNITVDDVVQWVLLSNNSLKEQYKWYYQNSTTYKFFTGTKNVVIYDKDNNIVSNTTTYGESYNNSSHQVLREDFSMYVLPSEFCEADNPEIINLANSIKKNTTDKSDKSVANAILNWVQTHIKYQLYSNTLYGALGTLHSKLGNCVDQASLTIALLRAVNIPAKYVSKQAIFENAQLGHAWPEIYLASYNSIQHPDYWVCAQPTSNIAYDLGTHASKEKEGDWCTVTPYNNSFFEGANYNFYKLIKIDGKWCIAIQDVLINETWIPYWK
ncbi:transglutaminase family protein [Methanobrevibacter arboriphilus]|uniref:transglutaminase-like domain-containing protein n=1 Tax=Methanobrevibacter arboriphilus TaxID=39441 RepID=UPI0006D075FA|nr:transglutaminase-like domain-containing protein [Methanobrevibacter arboriphilus]